VTRTTRPRSAIVPALLSATLLLAGCGGSGPAEQVAVPAPSATASGAAVATTVSATGAGATPTAGATAGPTAVAGTKVAATTASASATATPKPAAGPVPIVLDPKSIYDNWALADSTSHSVVLLISSDSCHGGPQITLNETATSVTILITEQLFGPFDCHGILKIVREVASLEHPLGKRYLEGCRPMQEKTGARVNCRTAKSP
jgi:hypothetical protein